MNIKEIVLETTDGKKIHLSPDEAKDLHRQLDELFAYPKVYPAPVYPCPTYPVYPTYSSTIEPPYQLPQTWCASNAKN